DTGVKSRPRAPPIHGHPAWEPGKIGYPLHMKFSRRLLAAAALFASSSGLTSADEKSLNPKIVKLVGEVSETRIRATIEKLVSFGTRNTMSTADDPERGIGAAREWILKEFQSYSPRL